MLKRIIWHWTAGAYGVINMEADAYHFIVNKDGSVSAGLDAPEANIPPLRAGAYAAHTLNLNSNSIGIAIDSMAGAVERPFDAGPYPTTTAQIESLCQLTAKLCMKYGIPVRRETVLSHAEVQPTLGVTQRNKWDITWLPGMTEAGDPVNIGDSLRARVAVIMATRVSDERAVGVKVPATTTPPKRGLCKAIRDFFGFN